MLIFITFFFYHTFHVPFVPSLHRSQRFLFGEKNQNFILEFSVVIVLLPLLNCCSLPLNLYRGNKRYPSEFWFQRVLHTPIMQQQPNSPLMIRISHSNQKNGSFYLRYEFKMNKLITVTHNYLSCIFFPSWYIHGRLSLTVTFPSTSLQRPPLEIWYDCSPCQLMDRFLYVLYGQCSRVSMYPLYEKSGV